MRTDRMRRPHERLHTFLGLAVALAVVSAGRVGWTQEEPEEPTQGEEPDLDEPTATDEEADEYETTVTVSREEQLVFETDRSIHLVDTEKMNRLGAQSLPEALQETTGVLVQTTNRGAGSPIMRGLVGPQNLILIDGIRFNNSTFRTGPNQYLALIDPSSVDRVEVLLGPGSVLYGSDAMGGVINAIPVGWPQEVGPGGRAGARFASPDLSTSFWGRASWQGDDARVLAGGAFRRFGTLTAGEGVEQPISDYYNGAWQVRGEVDVGDSTLGLSYLGARVRDAGREDRLYEGRFRFYDNDDDFAWADWRYRPGGALRELRVAASFHRTWELVERFRCSLPDDPQVGAAGPCLDAGLDAREAGRGGVPRDPLTRQRHNEDEVLTPGLLANATFGFLNNRIRLVTGLEGYMDFVSSSQEGRRGDREPPWEWSEADRGNFSEGSTYASLGGYANAEGDIVRDGPQALVLGAGLRVSHIGARADAVPGLGDVAYDWTGVVATAGLRYLHGLDFMVYVNGSQGFRAPNLQETTVLGDTGSKFEVPNDNLVPETSNALEVGGRVSVWPVDLHTAGFLTEMDNFIDERELSEEEWLALGIDPDDVGDKPVVQRVNSTTGTFYGVEATLALGPFLNVTPWGQVSWMRGDIETADGGSTPARRIPAVMGAAGVRYEHPDDSFYAELFVRFSGKQDRLHPSDESDLRICEDPDSLGNTYGDSGMDCPGTPGWTTLNIRGGYHFGDLIRADLAVTNLTDKLYRYHGSGVDAPGFGATISVIGQF